MFQIVENGQGEIFQCIDIYFKMFYYFDVFVASNLHHTCDLSPTELVSVENDF